MGSGLGGAGMSPELIGIVAVGVALAGLVLVSNRALRAGIRDVRAEIKDVRTEVKDLRERMARIEGVFEGFLRRPPRQELEPAVASGQ